MRLPSALLAMCDQALVSGASFAVTAALARCSAADDFGRFSLGLTVAVTLMGVHQALVLSPQAMLAPERSREEGLAYQAALDRLHLLLVLAGLAAALPLALAGGVARLAAATLAALVCRMAAEHVRRSAYARGQASSALVVDAVGYLPLAVVAGCLWHRPLPLPPDAGLWLLAAAGALSWAFSSWRHRIAAEAEPLRQVAAAHWRQGRILLASTVVQWASELVYPFLVAGMLGLREVGLLLAARTLMNMGNVALNGIEAWGVPKLRRDLLTKGAACFVRSAWQVSGFLVGLIAVLGTLVCLAPGRVMGLVFGAGYSEAGWILMAFAGIFVLRAAGRSLAMVLIALKRPDAGLVGTCITAGLTLTLGPMLVAHAGLAGAVTAFAGNAAIMVVVLAVGLRGCNLAEKTCA